MSASAFTPLRQTDLPEPHRRFEAGLVLYILQAAARLDEAVGARGPSLRDQHDPEPAAQAAIATLRIFCAKRVAPDRLALMVDAYVRATYWVRPQRSPLRAALARTRLLPAVPMRIGDLRSLESVIHQLGFLIHAAARPYATGEPLGKLCGSTRWNLRRIAQELVMQLRLPAHWPGQVARGELEIETLCGDHWHRPALDLPEPVLWPQWNALPEAADESAAILRWPDTEPTPADLHGGPCALPAAPLWPHAHDPDLAFAAGLALYMMQMESGVQRANSNGGPHALSLLHAFYRPRVWPTQLLPPLLDYAQRARGDTAVRRLFAPRALNSRQLNSLSLLLHDFAAVLDGTRTNPHYLVTLRVAAGELANELAVTLRLPREASGVIYIHRHEHGVPGIEIEAFVGADWMRPNRAAPAVREDW
jgi:hypothetical protein